MKRHIIFDALDIYNDEVRDSVRADMAECMDVSPSEISDNDVDECILDGLSDEECNLNKQVDGVLVAYADLGLWDGRHMGARVLGDNLSDIFSIGGDMNTWYADRYNVRCVTHHHDGTNFVLFRLAESREKAEKIVRKVLDGMTESAFMRATKSIVPYVNQIYGW